MAVPAATRTPCLFRTWSSAWFLVRNANRPRSWRTSAAESSTQNTGSSRHRGSLPSIFRANISLYNFCNSHLLFIAFRNTPDSLSTCRRPNQGNTIRCIFHNYLVTSSCNISTLPCSSSLYALYYILISAARMKCILCNWLYNIWRNVWNV